MNEMHTDPQQILIFYNVGNSTHEKTVAHAKGTGKEVLAFDFMEAPSAYGIWTQIWEGLGPEGRDIFDQNDDRYDELIAGKSFDFNDWRNICLHNADLIRCPIAISGTQVIAVERPTEIYRLQNLSPDAKGGQLPPEQRAHNDIDELGLKLDR